MQHIECLVKKGTEEKKVYLPETAAIVGREIRIQKRAGWKIVRILGEPETPPPPLQEGPIQ